MNEVLASSPKYLRSPISRGATPRVDREGGYRGAGIIRGVSVISEGEALGHDMWIDRQMVEQVSDAINAQRNGVKSRFCHPSLSADGLGKHVGRIMDSELSTDGRQAIADLHFVPSAHDTPDGDLAGYLMTLAEDDPQAFGLSIVFSIDSEAMEQVQADNANNYPHARLAELRAVDAVDEPAANPNGLFHRNDIVQKADALASYALGLTAEHPETVELGLDPDRVRGFVSRFLSNHKLEIRTMPEELATETVTTVTESVTTIETADESPTPEQTETSSREEAARFHATFGDRGAVWFAEGLSFDAARERETQELRKENDELKKKLASRTDGEDSPVTFDANESKRSGFASKIRCK